MQARAATEIRGKTGLFAAIATTRFPYTMDHSIVKPTKSAKSVVLPDRYCNPNTLMYGLFTRAVDFLARVHGSHTKRTNIQKN